MKDGPVTLCGEPCSSFLDAESPEEMFFSLTAGVTFVATEAAGRDDGEDF